MKLGLYGKYGNLTIFCNGCGQEMTRMGIWPFAQQHTSRYSCTTCRVPHPSVKYGVPVQVSIVETEPEAVVYKEVERA